MIYLPAAINIFSSNLLLFSKKPTTLGYLWHFELMEGGGLSRYQLRKKAWYTLLLLLPTVAAQLLSGVSHANQKLRSCSTLRITEVENGNNEKETGELRMTESDNMRGDAILF
jgi:hypothetical protein